MDLEAPSNTIEQPTTIDAAAWRKKIGKAKSKLESWRAEAKKYFKIYESGKSENETDEDSDLKDFNILYSNTETLRSVVYNQPPKPRAVKKFKDNNDVARNVVDVLERGLEFIVEDNDIDDVMRSRVNETLLSGFGQVRVRYEPKVMQETVLNEFGEVTVVEKLVFQKTTIEPVCYDAFIWDCGKRWADVAWVCFEHHFNRKEMKSRFGLDEPDYSDSEYVIGGTDGKTKEHGCTVYEVWDKDERKVFWLAEGHEHALNEVSDPLGLEGFFPVPKPMQFIRRVNSTIPLPEYRVYKKLAEGLSRAIYRRNKIIEYIKATGARDSSSPEVDKILSGSDGEMVAVKVLTMDGAGVDISKMFALLPIEGFARVIAQLDLTIERLKQAIYELTGVSDIMRGQSAASESATAQRIKGNFGTLRVQERQKEVARFVRDVVRIAGEIMAEHYTPEILSMIAGKPVGEAEMKVMRDQSVRSFTIGIEEDSIVKPDEEIEQRTAVEFITAVGQFFTTMGPMVEPNGMIPISVASELLMTAVRRFRGVRGFEEVLDKWVSEMQAKQAALTAPQPSIGVGGTAGGLPIAPQQLNGSFVG